MKRFLFRTTLITTVFYFLFLHGSFASTGCAVDDFYNVDIGVDLIVDITTNDCGLNTIVPGTLVSTTNPDATIALAANGTLTYNSGPTFFGTDEFFYLTCDLNQLCDTGYVYIEVITCIDLNLYMFLEGAFDINTMEMKTTLNLKQGSLAHRGFLPGQTPLGLGATPTPAGQPYNQPPYNYSGTPAENSFAGPYDEDVVDWVYIHFRRDLYSSPITSARVGLLYKDGRIELIGDCLMSADISLVGCYIFVEHRNHMAVLSQYPVWLVGTVLEYDFRIQNSWTPISGGFGQKQIFPGVFAAFAGDVDKISDFPAFDINHADVIFLNSENGLFNQYLQSDLNFDNQVNGADKALWSINNGISNRVSKFYD